MRKTALYPEEYLIIFLDSVKKYNPFPPDTNL